MSNLHFRFGAAALLLLLACGGDDDGVESAVEQLRPAATPCVTSDDCLYGYCSTEDGDCRRVCPPGASTCAAVCYGTCIAAAPPE